jgi:glycosyltransferase involved in cell wall biosynthesis
MLPSPQVSVVMTVWNGTAYIAESIDSILRQTFSDLELIIIDDGSTDDTCSVIESFTDPRIRLIRRPHLGVVPSANFGVSQARGSYIARMDADDISLPERLARQVAALDKNAAAVLCFTDTETFGDITSSHKEARFRRDNASYLIGMCWYCPFLHSSVLFRKDAFDQIGGYLDKHPAEDFSLFTRLIRIGSFIGIPLKLVKYRRHAASATFRRMDDMLNFSKEISLDHIQYFLKVDEFQAEEFFRMLQLPSEDKNLHIWFKFCRKVLSHSACWRPEPLGWLILHTVKIVTAGKTTATS